MEILKDIELKNYTTFKMGGLCKNLYIPSSQDELIDLVSSDDKEYLFIGGGSNLLIDDKGVFDNVVLLREFDDSIVNMGDGEFLVGASVRLQRLIREINSRGYGGIEYLFSVPALTGGAVYMNAGRGRTENKCISDYIIEVKALHNGKVVYLSKDECCFSYRHSVFKDGGYLILSVKFKFKEGSKEQFDAAVKERLDHCKLHQDASKPNFGTVFSLADNRVMRIAAKLDQGKNKGVYFSHKTRNWLINENGTFKQAVSRLKLVQFLHKVLGKSCNAEVIIWK